MNIDVNPITSELDVYPMEQLIKIKTSLQKENKKIYDFGVGDPRLPLWQPLIEAIKDAVQEATGYPSIKGIDELLVSQKRYLEKRFSIAPCEKIMVIPTRGSKEAIFHMALSLVGRKGKKTIAYPAPGYPVYKSSALFSGGRPYPIELNIENNYLVEPWTLPTEIINDLCALWVNYPHNPTGKSVDEAYWIKLISWCNKHDVILLSDESYSDLYDVKLDSEDKKHLRPLCPLSYSSHKVLSFFSLSKRSGFTGLRSGFIAGDINILKPHLKARANFGLASPVCIQKGASLAWSDDEHVKERRIILSKRMDQAYSLLRELDMIGEKPVVPFYLWVKIPTKVEKDDISFCLDLGKKGFIATPASWLGSKDNRHLRISLTVSEAEIKSAFEILKQNL